MNLWQVSRRGTADGLLLVEKGINQHLETK